MDLIRCMQTIKEEHDYSTYDYVRTFFRIHLWKRVNALAT